MEVPELSKGATLTAPGMGQSETMAPAITH